MRHNKKCLIKQPAGIGDIFFLQKAAYFIQNAGYEIIWPIKDQFSFIKNYIQLPYIEFIEESNEFLHKDIYQSVYHILNTDDFLYIPFQYADLHYMGCTQRAKYKMIDVDYTDWNKYLNINRNQNKERTLYYDILKLNDSSDYNFINRNYGSFPNYVQKQEVKSNNTLIDIEMRDIEGYSIFDWLYVIENAKNIYTVDTSLLYLIDGLNLRADNGELQMWSRINNYTNITGLFKKNFKLN